MAYVHTNLSKAEILARLPKSERNAIVSSYTEAQLNLLQADWDFWARPNQKLPLSRPWLVWLILSGRGYGKTRTGAETINYWQNPSKNTTAMSVKGVRRIAIIGQTTADVRDIMLEGESGLITCAPFYNKPRYIASRRVVEWPNGAQAHLFSGDEPEQLRGPQFEKAWVDELAKFKYPNDCWDNLEFGLRLDTNGNVPQVVVTTTPKPIKLIKELAVDPDVFVTYGSSYENMSNLSEAYIKRIIKRYEGTRIGAQELEGRILTDIEGALWKYSTIAENRVTMAPSLDTVTIVLDPSVTNKDTSDECGIIVMGRKSGHAFVLEDHSAKMSSKEWAELAVKLYHKHKADYVLAEVNNGGDLVKTVISLLDPRVPVHTVFATRDKYTRATPAAGVYEQNRVHHVGTFDLLEEELTEWEPGKPSPNRLDAVVWGVTDLLLSEDEKNLPGRMVAIERPF